MPATKESRQQPRYKSLELVAAREHGPRSRKTWTVRKSDARIQKHVFESTTAKASKGSLNGVTLLGVFKSYIRHRDARQVSLSTEYLLETLNYSFADIEFWAELLDETDSSRLAASLSADRLDEHKVRDVPLFLLSLILRRPSLSAIALRSIVQRCWTVLEHGKRSTQNTHERTSTLFALFRGLVRHARMVWPEALENITEMFLRHFTVFDHRSGTWSSIPRHEQAKYLNSALCLLVVPTAIEPIKNRVIQEAAMLRVLRFMAEPAISIPVTRNGYRAVISMQLAQHKTAEERVWAELKARSWPPWKVDRTAMDGDIVADEHGVSQAANTLAQLEQAGYAAHDWEKVAMIYSGWDYDGTPTIQERVLLQPSQPWSNFDAAVWVARVTVTRTIQEAWAAYLAYEGAKLPPSQAVYLAVFRKLHGEERRQRDLDQIRGPLRTPAWPLHSGDAREVEALPPSSHLYTITRTEPPTLDGFYRHLCREGVDIKKSCLAFLVENAMTFRLGFEYLSNSFATQPEGRALLLLDNDSSLDEVPTRILTSFINLLCRYSNTPTSNLIPPQTEQRLDPTFASRLLGTTQLSVSHALVHAIELLARQRPFYRSAWNAVLEALSHDTTHENIERMYNANWRKNLVTLSLQSERGRAALMAYGISQKLLGLMRETQLDLDVDGFHAVCIIMENAVIGSWQILRDDQDTTDGSATGKAHVQDAIKFLRTASHSAPLSNDFHALVGGEGIGTDLAEPDHIFPDDAPLPRLSVTPSSAILHAYIRALGWCADFHGLLACTRWMVEYNPELAERRKRDRNGQDLMRRALVALRIFIERTWLDKAEVMSLEEANGRPQEAANEALRRLVTPASPEMVSEIRGLVESVPDWHGWPDEDEVDSYLQHERMRAFMREAT